MNKELSAGEVANMLGTPYFRVIRMIKRGEFPGAHKVGWGWVIPKEAFDNVVHGTVELVSDNFEFIPSKRLTQVMK